MSARVASKPQDVARIDPLFTASDVARKLGHTPLRQGHDYECWTCALSGSINGDEFAGTIFEEQCR